MKYVSPNKNKTSPPKFISPENTSLRLRNNFMKLLDYVSGRPNSKL